MKKNKRVKLNLQKVITNISLVFMFIIVIVLSTSTVSAKKEVVTKSITVENSDTLWSIASNVSDDTNLNIQKVIYDIKEVNGLKSSDIFEGQTLEIPVY